MFEIFTVAEEEFVSVTNCGVVGEPIVTVPKLRFVGATCNVASWVGVAVGVVVGVAAAPAPAGPIAVAVGVGMKIPVPVIEMTCGLLIALSVTVRVSDRGPGCCGAKVTLIVHEALGLIAVGH